VLESEGIECHVVDPASIATSRRRRRAKTHGIDGEALLACKRGEPRVCTIERVRHNGGRFKKTTIVALARKLLVALRKYVTSGPA
jgi:transposase